jgi:predicted PurR-regulated permease PerM
MRLWLRGLIIGLTLLVWLTVSGMILWGLSKVGSALTLLLVSMLMAYTIHPLVRLLQRFLPRVVAVALVYIGILGGLLVLLYFIVFTAMVQLVQIAQQLQRTLPHVINDLKPFLERIGLSASSLQMSSQWLISQLLVVVGNIQPLLFNIFAVVLSSILVITLSIYFVLDGQRATHRLREHSPISVRPHVRFFWTPSTTQWAVLFVGSSFWECSSARYRHSDCLSLAFLISFFWQ